MSFKITGLDELQKQLDDAAQALQGLGGEIGTVNFNPNDPSTVEAAAAQMESIIDAKNCLLSRKQTSGKSRSANEGKIPATDI
jgi:hypothetical protein